MFFLEKYEFRKFRLFLWQVSYKFRMSFVEFRMFLERGALLLPKALFFSMRGEHSKEV